MNESNIDFNEPPSNIGFNATCKPDPKLAKKKPSWFIGKAVKIGFEHSEGIERMWVQVKRASKGTCFGILDNDPICFSPDELACGDKVTFTPDEAIEVI